MTMVHSQGLVPTEQVDKPAGHTPGPWMAAAKPSSVVGWPVVATPMGRMICDVTYVSHGPIDPQVPGDDAFNRESRANARLIAAAPELLEACVAAQFLLASLCVDRDSKTRTDLRAAIAAATGAA